MRGDHLYNAIKSPIIVNTIISISKSLIDKPSFLPYIEGTSFKVRAYAPGIIEG